MASPPPAADLPTEPPAMMGDEKMVEDDAAQQDGAMMQDAPKNDSAMLPDVAPFYVDYTEALHAEAAEAARPIVLYLYAAWCPICRAEDPKIASWIETSDLPVAGFRVNYDTETELKAKHKIPYQHTTLFLGRRGEEVERFLGPVSESEFRAALEKAAK